MKKVFKTLAFLILFVVLFFCGFLTYSTLVDYEPGPLERVSENRGGVISINDTLNIFNWNIGYCGLGSDMSFFYDGGTAVRCSEERVAKNISGVLNQISSADSIDFFLFQEVDLDSKRSYYSNQTSKLQGVLEGYHQSFAYNFKVAFVPIKVTEPIGKVNSGLTSYSNVEAFSVFRHSFIGNYSWPMSLFMLDRCFMVQRFYTSNGKELLIINTHNSAYDDGTLRKKQMILMREFLLSEFKKGNYILVGGDWNQMYPKEGADMTEKKDKNITRLRVASDFMPSNWSWQFDESIPTNRMLYEPYNETTTGTAIIDFYLLSPNLQALSVKNIDLQFEHSDHQPVVMKFVFAE